MKSSKAKADEQINQTLGQEKKTRYKKQKKSFITESNYYIDELLLSGDVLFNDPVGTYVNKVMDSLLKDEPELRKQLEVYVVKSSIVNAITTSRGTILVYLGLIAKLHSEAELAYVLSHEIIHYKNKHSMTEFDVAEDIRRGKGAFRNTAINDKMLAQSMFSKELEKEADVEGFQIFLKSKYNLQATNGVFDILQFSHTPFTELAFNKSYLETASLKFPGSYQLEKTRPVVADDKDDTFGTHPGVAIRRDTINALLKGQSNIGRKNYLIDSTEFINLREIARFEIVEYYIENMRYEAALYCAYALLKSHPDNLYLEKAIMRSLYGLSKYAKEDRYDEVHYDYMKVEGGRQEVYYLFSKMKAREISVTALSYIWNLKKKYPADQEIASLANDQFMDLVDNYFAKRNFFSTIADTAVHKDTAATMINFTQSDDEEVKEPKIHKIARRVKHEETSRKSNTIPGYLKYAFVDELKDPEFVKTFDKLAKGRKGRLNDKKESESARAVAIRKKNHDKLVRQGQAMGISKVVFVNPFYYKTTSGYEVNVKQVASEEAQIAFNTKIHDIAQMSGLDFDIIDKKHLEEGGAGAFNDISTLTNWIEEYYHHGSAMHLINHQRDDVKALIEKYHTKYFCWTGFISEKSPNYFVFTKIVASFFIFPVLPYVIYKAVQPQYKTMQYTIIMDLSTGAPVYVQLHEYKMKDHNDMVEANFYDLCMQIKSPIAKQENETTKK